jgi:epoxide hydrolase-like predicted phosphatase
VIKAVIFDCFGVLTTDGWKQIREEFLVHDEKLFRHSLDIDKAVNAGMMDYDEFINEIKNMTGLSTNNIRERLNGSVPNKMLFDFIRESLKHKYKIGMLSNAAANWLDELFEPWQVKLFDATVLSYEAGTVKPDPAIYKMIMNRLGVTPEESIYIDDSERYCIAAEDLGMKSIYHHDTNQTIAKIKELASA